MGEEISSSRFTEEDFSAYKERLDAETALLSSWAREGRFADDPCVGGFEIEAWLTDRTHLPAPINERYLERVGAALVFPELAKFNVELNSAPRRLHGAALRLMRDELEATWRHCDRTARDMDANLVMIGTLPTVEEHQLVLENMSAMKRYAALNDQVFRLRQGRPMQLDIVGREHLRTVHQDVMLESATTSFQIHVQVPRDRAVRTFNAALIVSAPMVAVSANAPFLFGKDLWDETRIPLFEQAVDVGGIAGAAFGPLRRVTFGSGYARHSLEECFLENRDHYPILLPMRFDDEPSRLSHLRLHNGTIWRWNRPLVGFDHLGQPHLRIEHRVVPAGPTIVDAIANAALFFGLVEALGTRPDAPEAELPFAQARDNFYKAARHGLQAHIGWLGGKRGTVQVLTQDVLLPLARQGLEQLDFDRNDVDDYLGIIEARVRTGRTGAAWQRAYVEKHGRDMQALTEAYLDRQRSGKPVDQWD